MTRTDNDLGLARIKDTEHPYAAVDAKMMRGVARFLGSMPPGKIGDDICAQFSRSKVARSIFALAQRRTGWIAENDAKFQKRVQVGGPYEMFMLASERILAWCTPKTCYAEDLVAGDVLFVDGEQITLEGVSRGKGHLEGGETFDGDVSIVGTSDTMGHDDDTTMRREFGITIGEVVQRYSNERDLGWPECPLMTRPSAGRCKPEPCQTGNPARLTVCPSCNGGIYMSQSQVEVST